jgi:short-subunit dehydrogenase
LSRCEEFAAKSCKVYATSRNIATIGAFKNPSIEKLAFDVTSDNDVERVIKTILDAEGKIDIVVNNAGVMGISRSVFAKDVVDSLSCHMVGPLVDLSLERVKNIFDTNTFAALRTAKAVVPFMAKRRSGLIINIGSIVAEMYVGLDVVSPFKSNNPCSPTPWNGIYSASKAALHTLTEVLQMECRPFNIDVMLVSPGTVRSNIADNQAAIFKLPLDSLYTRYLHNIMERMYSSQGEQTMATDAFAQEVVSKALRKEPPSYMTTGGRTTLFALLKWLPRAWALYFMWRRFSKPVST